MKNWQTWDQFLGQWKAIGLAYSLSQSGETLETLTVMLCALIVRVDALERRAMTSF